jgi:hypothetical protein
MLTIAALAALAAAGRFSISEGYPVAWAPLPLAVVIPVFGAMSATGEALSLRWYYQSIPSLVGPALCFAWYPDLLTGASQVPRRTLIGLVLLSALTAIHFVMGWDFGLRYQGLSYVVTRGLRECRGDRSLLGLRHLCAPPVLVRSDVTRARVRSALARVDCVPLARRAALIAGADLQLHSRSRPRC